MLGKRSRSRSYSRSYNPKRYKNSKRATPYALSKRALSTRGFRSFAVPSMAREKKVFDCGDQLGIIGTIDVDNVASIGFVQPMFIPLLGSDFNNRIGRKCVIKSIYMKYRCFPRYIENPGGAPYVAQSQWPQTAIRVLIVKDTNPNGVTPAITDMLQVDTATGLVDPLSFINMNNRDRFTIIFDKLHQFGAFSTGIVGVSPIQSALGPVCVTKKFYKKCNHEVIFNGSSTGLISDIASGALYVVYLGSETLGSNRYGNLENNWRIRYDDA